RTRTSTHPVSSSSPRTLPDALTPATSSEPDPSPPLHAGPDAERSLHATSFGSTTSYGSTGSCAGHGCGPGTSSNCVMLTSTVSGFSSVVISPGASASTTFKLTSSFGPTTPRHAGTVSKRNGVRTVFTSTVRCWPFTSSTRAAAGPLSELGPLPEAAEHGCAEPAGERGAEARLDRCGRVRTARAAAATGFPGWHRQHAVAGHLHVGRSLGKPDQQEPSLAAEQRIARVEGDAALRSADPDDDSALHD